MIRTLLLIISAIVILGLSLKTCSLSNDNALLNSNQEMIKDSLQVFKNKHGELVAQNYDLQVSKASDLKTITALTEEQKRLKEIAKDNRRATSGIAVTVKTDQTGKEVTTIIDSVTVFRNDTTFIYPTYQTSIASEYRTGTITASKDTIEYQISETVPLDIVQTTKGGWFKKKETIVEVKTKNPSVNITGLASFSVKEPKRRIHLGPYIGYGIDFQGKFSPQVGLGLTFSIL